MFLAILLPFGGGIVQLPADGEDTDLDILQMFGMLRVLIFEPAVLAPVTLWTMARGDVDVRRPVRSGTQMRDGGARSARCPAVSRVVCPVRAGITPPAPGLR